MHLLLCQVHPLQGVLLFQDLGDSVEYFVTCYALCFEPYCFIKQSGGSCEMSQATRNAGRSYSFLFWGGFRLLSSNPRLFFRRRLFLALSSCHTGCKLLQRLDVVPGGEQDPLDGDAVNKC
ncbi:hypothetical protein ES703_121373 [subsurface metagenome]